jgi:hypothetical protein
MPIRDNYNSRTVRKSARKAAEAVENSNAAATNGHQNGAEAAVEVAEKDVSEDVFESVDEVSPVFNFCSSSRTVGRNKLECLLLSVSFLVPEVATKLVKLST